MKYEHAHWGWMLGTDFFLAGSGSGLLIAAGSLDLFAGHPAPFLPVGLTAAVLIGAGALLLVLELGRPFQSWRVFTNPRALLTLGAWMMLSAIGCAVIYASFGLPWLPWSNWSWLRLVVAAAVLVLGAGISTYPGLFLGRMKGRGFWSGPGIVVLFLLSALTTGAALLSLIAVAASDAGIAAALPPVLAMLLVLQAVLWPVYLYVKVSGGTIHEARAARRWLRGDRAVAFWGGVLSLGLVVPLLLLWVGSSIAFVLASLAILAGGVTMRLQVVASNDRAWLPGEEAFAASLPRSDHPIFHTWQ